MRFVNFLMNILIILYALGVPNCIRNYGNIIGNSTIVSLEENTFSHIISGVIVNKIDFGIYFIQIINL